MVTYTGLSIKEEEHTLLQLKEELKDVESSIMALNANLEELNQRKYNACNSMQQLWERNSMEGAHNVVQRLLPLLESLKDLERQESDFQSHCNAMQSKLQADIYELEKLVSSGNDDKSLSNGLSHSFHDSIERLNSAKRELATKLREILLLKRKIDAVPTQAELILYERRFSELYANIQGKLRKTRKYYATFNALLEIKELMLKETSLLNSISSQFQDAITSTTGRTKLIESMDGIVKGTQQEECAKNEYLRSQTSGILP